MRGTRGHAPSKRLVVSLVQVHETPTAVGTEFQSFVGVAEKFRPSSLVIDVRPISLDIVEYAIRFSPEVPIGIIKSATVCSDPVHGLSQFRVKDSLRDAFGFLFVSGTWSNCRGSNRLRPIERRGKISRHRSSTA